MAMSSTSSSPRVSSAATSPSRRWRDLAILLVLLALVVAGLLGLALATGWEETLEAIRALTGVELVILLLLSLVNYVFRGLRWHLFAGRLGLSLSLGANLRHFLGGFAMSVTPGRVGELVRMRWIRRETGWSFERTAPLVLMDRASDLAAMALLLAVALMFSTGGIAGALPVAILALIAAWVVTRPDLMHRLASVGYRLVGRRLPRLFARIRRAARALESFTAPSLLVVAALLGLIGWAAEGWAFHLLLTWMGAEIGMMTAIAIFVFATLAGGVTGAPGGLGGAEAAMVALLVLNGVALEIAVPATLIIRVTTLWFAIGIGFLVFPAAERLSKKAEHALETD